MHIAYIILMAPQTRRSEDAMDTAMRDLEQIQEHRGGDEGGLRRAGVFVMAAGTTLALVYGVGALMSERPTGPSAHDPLAALGATAPIMDAVDAAEEEERTRVRPEDLSFHENLIGDERPEVEAAIRAAGAEHAALGHVTTPIPPAPLGLGATPASAPPVALPVADVATGTAATLVDTARRDPLVAAAVVAVDPPAEDAEEAQEGEDGQYTLQVASFRLEDEADVFARALRDRGHNSFVVRAEIEGRGVFHRVRVGPFETPGAASRYRRTFEHEERMDAYVVRNRDFGREDDSST